MGLDIHGFVVERDELELIDVDRPSQLESGDLTPPPGQITQLPTSPIIALPDSGSELSDTPDGVLEEQDYTGGNDASEEEDSGGDDAEFDDDEAARRCKCSKEVPES